MLRPPLRWRLRQLAGAAALAAWVLDVRAQGGRATIAIEVPLEGLPLIIHWAHLLAPIVVFLPFLFPPRFEDAPALSKGLRLLALAWLAAAGAATYAYARDAVVNPYLFAVDGFVCFGRENWHAIAVGAAMAVLLLLDVAFGANEGEGR